MPGTKEIRVKIKSVQNTRKITKAMEMVAASKMRKAQERMRMARPYGEKIRNVAAHISHANPEYRHPFLVHREWPWSGGILGWVRRNGRGFLRSCRGHGYAAFSSRAVTVCGCSLAANPFRSEAGHEPDDQCADDWNDDDGDAQVRVRGRGWLDADAPVEKEIGEKRDQA